MRDTENLAASSFCGWIGLFLIGVGCWIVDPALSFVVTGILLLGLALIGKLPPPPPGDLE